MVVPVYIDVSEVADEFSLSDQQVNQMIDRAIKAITYDYFLKWQGQASQLKQTKRRYLDSLIYQGEGIMKGAVILRYDDPLVRMLEEGSDPRDMKEAFKKSSKAKSKNNGGWYLTVPLRYGASTSIGESEVFSGILPTEVYDQVKTFEPNIPIGGGFRSRGMKLEEIPDKFKTPPTRKAIPKSKMLRAFEEKVAKHSKYEGLVKIKDTSTQQTRGYMSFRRVSDKSDDDSWIHPGLDERNFAEKALEEHEKDQPQIVDNIVDNYLNAL